MTATLSTAENFVELAQVNVKEWAQLVRDSPTAFYASPDLQRAAIGLNGASEEKAVVCRDSNNSARAIIPVFHYSEKPSNMYIDPGWLFGVADRDDIDGARWQPVTLLGSTTGYANDPIAVDTTSWVDALCEAAEMYKNGVVALQHVNSETMAQLRKPLTDACGQLPVLLTAVRAILRVRGSSWDEHVESLPARSRNHVREDLRKFRQGDRMMTVLPLRKANFDLMAELMSKTFRHHSRDVAPAFFHRYLSRMAEADIGRDGVVFSCWDGNDMVAFSLCFRWQSSFPLRAIGLDYQRTGQHGEYGHVLVHGPVDYALAHGLSTVDLGLESIRAKLGRGAEPALMWTVLLRPPEGWTGAHTARHNTVKAAEWLAEYGKRFASHDVNVLQELVSTGS